VVCHIYTCPAQQKSYRVAPSALRDATCDYLWGLVCAQPEGSAATEAEMLAARDARAAHDEAL
jgi:hypothetical protein